MGREIRVDAVRDRDRCREGAWCISCISKCKPSKCLLYIRCSFLIDSFTLNRAFRLIVDKILCVSYVLQWVSWCGMQMALTIICYNWHAFIWPLLRSRVIPFTATSESDNRITVVTSFDIPFSKMSSFGIELPKYNKQSCVSDGKGLSTTPSLVYWASVRMMMQS